MHSFKYNLRSLAVRKGTTLASMAGIAMVVFLVAATLMLVVALRRTLETNDRTDTAIVIRSSADNEFSSSIYDAEANVVATEPGVKQVGGAPLVSPELVVAVTLPKNDGSRGNVQLRGVTDDVFKVRSDAKIVAGRPARFGADEALIGDRIKGRFTGFEIGDSFELRKGRVIKVVGMFHAGLAYDSEVWIDRETARTTFGRSGRVSSVYVRLENAESFGRFKAALAQDKRLGLQAIAERDYFQTQTDGRAAFIIVMGTLVGLLFGVGAMIGAMLTMFAAVENRQREVGTLRALGFPRSTLLFGFLLESVAVALAGGLVGVIAAIGLAFTRLTMLDMNTRTEMVLDFQATPSVMVVAIGCSLIMGLGGGLLPAWWASRVPVVAALRH